jgi:hypothetical protein
MAATSKKKPSPLLLAAFVLLIAVLGYTYRGLIFGRGAADPAAADQKITIDAKLQGLKALPALRIDRPVESDGYQPGRNLFDFGPSPEQRQAEQARAEAMHRAEEQRQKAEVEHQKYVEVHKNDPPPPPQPPPPPPKPQPPNFGGGWRYIAWIKEVRSGDFLAILTKSAAGPSKPQGFRVGETIDTQFVVKKIDIDAVTIGYTDPQFKDQTETVKLIPAASGKGTK